VLGEEARRGWAGRGESACWRPQPRASPGVNRDRPRRVLLSAIPGYSLPLRESLQNGITQGASERW